jgi:hypothetical protein
MLRLFSVATLKKQKTRSTPTVKLEKLDITAAPATMPPPDRDVAFGEKLHEQLRLQKQLTTLKRILSRL